MEEFAEIEDRTPSEPQVQSVSLLTQDPPLKALVLWKPPQKTYDMSIIKYIVWYKPIDHIEYSRKDVDGNANQAELDGLLMGRLYEIKVAAENADGLSANATESLNTPVGVPEAAPLNVRYEFDDGKLEISWDPPAIDQRNGNITYYYAVLTTPDGDGPGFTQNVTSGKSTTFMATATKAYSFKVAAATVKGQGPFSTALDINPDPTGAILRTFGGDVFLFLLFSIHCAQAEWKSCLSRLLTAVDSHLSDFDVVSGRDVGGGSGGAIVGARYESARHSAVRRIGISIRSEARESDGEREREGVCVSARQWTTTLSALLSGHECACNAQRSIDATTTTTTTPSSVYVRVCVRDMMGLMSGVRGAISVGRQARFGPVEDEEERRLAV
uniref:Fibronectin type-III domain-containing protein n=1 Tax=Plectus sambesii TaxID=2011161 RepID=A0A914X6K9_9BILA